MGWMWTWYLVSLMPFWVITHVMSLLPEMRKFSMSWLSLSPSLAWVLKAHRLRSWSNSPYYRARSLLFSMLSLSLRLIWSTRTLRSSQNIEEDSSGYWELSMVPVSQVSLVLQSIGASWQTALLELPPPQFKLVNDSILWAVKHTMRDIADLGLSSMSLIRQSKGDRW